MKILKVAVVVAGAFVLGACGLIKEASIKNDGEKMWSFGRELAFFGKYGVPTLILGEGDSLIAVSPAWQARVMTSTCEGTSGDALGWINRELIAFQKDNPQLVQLGGEDRLQLGPQGGEASLFFEKNKALTEENILAPAFLSKEPWQLVARSKTRAKFEKTADFENMKGTKFKVKIERDIATLDRKASAEILGIEIPDGVKMVAFQSLNKLTNLGDKAWTEASGLLNLSVQSCFNASKSTYVFIPYAKSNGDIARDDFQDQAISPNENTKRLLVTNNYIRFKADGKYLSGISIPPNRSEGIAISYDDINKTLTIITYLRPAANPKYLPFSWRRVASANDSGDAISLFNNGALGRGTNTAGAYFEVSTHSPAIDASPQQSQFHLQRTFHFKGSEYDLGLISYKLTGISIGELRGEN